MRPLRSILSAKCSLLAGCCLTAAFVSSPATAQTSAPTVDALRKAFLAPPPEARPMVRWWWFGAAVVKPEILKELQEMKASGIGGAELAFVYPEVLDDPTKNLRNLPFLSPEMLDAVTYAQAEARKIGLRIDVTLCSGWPYGGPATTLAHAVTRLRTAEIPVAAGSTTVAVPPLQPGESLISAVIAGPSTAPPPPPPAEQGTRNSGPRPPSFDAASATPLTLSGSTATLTASDKPRIAVFFIQSHTRQQVKRAALGAEGYVLDPFSHDAVATHLQAVGDPLVKAFGATPPYAIFSDSLEAYGADWTPALPAEFKKRRGYDLLPHLPELVAGGTPTADNTRHDYGVTLTELVNENYLTQISNWAIAHNTKFRSQTYGEPAVTFSSQNLVGLSEGEGPQWRAWSTLRWATSANHVFHHEVTSGETFTWLNSPVFRATPLDMKAEADIDFIMGENQLVFHGFPYSPPDLPDGKPAVLEPGWSLYAAASFNRHNPWFPVLPEVDRYITRISYLMRQGQPASQVAILLPTDDVWATFSPTHTTITGAMQPRITPLMPAILSAGYNVDYIDAEAINKVGLGTHQVLVLPPTDRIPVETLQAISKWRMKHPDTARRPSDSDFNVICYQRCPSLDPSGKPLPGMTGSFLVADTLEDLVKDLTDVVKPDFALTAGDEAARTQLGFIRRKLPAADIYFVANTSPNPIDTTATFATTHQSGETWSADTGATSPARADAQPIHLAPYESRVFVFASSAASRPANPTASSPAPNSTQLANLSTDWNVNFVADHHSIPEKTLSDWTANPATLHYSGEAIYSRDFTLASASSTPVYLEVLGGKALPGAPNSPPEKDPAASVLGSDGLPNPAITRTGPGMHAFYDPPIREAALVTINGQPAGALWHPPYRLDISKLLKPGQNRVEIHVYNTALNAWSALPRHDYAPLIAKYGDRFQMQDLQQVEPIPSGLLGQVHIVTEAK